MRRKLAGYSFLSFFSFCFFTFIFHFVTSAHALAPNLDQQQPKSTKQIVSKPTTIPIQSTFITPTVRKKLVLASNSSANIPRQPELTETPTAIPTIIPSITTTPTPTTIPTLQPTTIISDIQGLFSKYSDDYHIDKNQLEKIARCESGFNSEATNGDYVGMYQFASQSWTSQRNSMGLDSNPDLRRNSEEAIRTAAYMLAHGQANAWPSCS